MGMLSCLHPSNKIKRRKDADGFRKLKKKIIADEIVEPEECKKKRKKEAKEGDTEEAKATEVPVEETKEKVSEKEGSGGSSSEEIVRKKKPGKYEKLLRKNVFAELDELEPKKETSKESDKEEAAVKPPKVKASKKRKIVYSDDDDAADKQPTSSSLESSSSDQSESDSSVGFAPARKRKGKNAKKTAKASSDGSDFAVGKSKKGGGLIIFRCEQAEEKAEAHQDGLFYS
ncbi:hypothetical protein MRX96_038812 [Rhipicephalus microplus]